MCLLNLKILLSLYRTILPTQVEERGVPQTPLHTLAEHAGARAQALSSQLVQHQRQGVRACAHPAPASPLTSRVACRRVCAAGRSRGTVLQQQLGRVI